MKRHGSLFHKITALENIHLAYQRARRGKGWQKKVQAFEKDIDSNLEDIRQSLIRKTFRTSSYRTKKIYEPKERDIFILPFAPDRIVQHALMNVIAPIWDNLFYFHSYACRDGKGIHAGSRKTMEYVRKNKYCLKMDISKFYSSINHDILYKIIQKKIKCKDTLWLVHNIVYSIKSGKNVPIGNYTSQWFGNLYMNELDQELKHQYKIKNYIRYCDDFILFHNSKRYLQEIANIIEEFLAKRLQLRLSKCSVFPVRHGIDFLGYRHFRKYILLRKNTVKRVRRRLKKLPQMMETGRITMEQFRSSLASTAGWLRWANTHNLSIKLQMNNLMELCDAV